VAQSRFIAALGRKRAHALLAALKRGAEIPQDLSGNHPVLGAI
jgi:hypothetical protein